MTKAYKHTLISLDILEMMNSVLHLASLLTSNQSRITLTHYGKEIARSKYVPRRIKLSRL